jgi:hypothetical protein
MWYLASQTDPSGWLAFNYTSLNAKLHWYRYKYHLTFWDQLFLIFCDEIMVRA